MQEINRKASDCEDEKAREKQATAKIINQDYRFVPSIPCYGSENWILALLLLKPNSTPNKLGVIPTTT